MHLEHIAPRRVFDDPEYLSWQRMIDVDKDEFNDYANKIGNLTLLPPNDHNSLDESSFDNKRKTYRGSDVKITEEIDNYDIWTTEEIEDRTDRLANELTERWSV